jgi:hypothetical protein
MAAATKDRATIKKSFERLIRLTVKSTSVIPAGVMVAVDATGQAVNASDTAALKVMGVSAHAADGTKGDVDILVERGLFWFAQDATIAIANVETLCEVVDNQTVSLSTTTNHIKAGYIEDVDATKGVLVAMLGGLIAAA